MSFNEVFINKTSHYFPNNPVSNDEMEEYLGYINNTPSKSKRIVLRNNGIINRYYALRKDGSSTHTNAELTALAVKELLKDHPDLTEKVELLSCGTSSPDQMMPSHGVQVHGNVPELGAIEVVSPAGVCCAGMHALKYAFLAIKTGDVQNAIATGSERFSASLRSKLFEDEVSKLIQLEENPYISFEKDFLRWMLSDGASAFYMSNQPNQEGLSLRVEWLKGVSYAHEVEVCMYMAGAKLPDGTLKSYLDYTPEELINQSIFSIKQDVKLLGEYIIKLGGRKLREVLDSEGVDPQTVDYFLPHMSSNFFRSKIMEGLLEVGIDLPYDKWFVNLSTVGNVGAASAYLMVDELFHGGKLKKGDRILLLVPESSRFSYVYGLLTVC